MPIVEIGLIVTTIRKGPYLDKLRPDRSQLYPGALMPTNLDSGRPGAPIPTPAE